MDINKYITTCTKVIDEFLPPVLNNIIYNYIFQHVDEITDHVMLGRVYKCRETYTTLFGKREGIRVRYCNNGITYYTMYRNGKLNGKAYGIRLGRVTGFVHFLNDKLHGESVEFYSNGHIKRQTMWVNHIKLNQFTKNWDSHGVRTPTVLDNN